MIFSDRNTADSVRETASRERHAAVKALVEYVMKHKDLIASAMNTDGTLPSHIADAMYDRYRQSVPLTSTLIFRSGIIHGGDDNMKYVTLYYDHDENAEVSTAMMNNRTRLVGGLDIKTGHIHT